MENTITFSDRLKMSSFIMTTKKFTYGEKVEEFEQKWNKWLGSKYSLFVSSGSTANFLLVAAIKEKYNLKDGDKVLVPSCTWVTNVGPIIQLGLQPIFCDINFTNFSFDYENLSYIKRQHPDIKMIFVTHLLGFAADNKIYKKFFPDAIIIDDVCESHGARFLNGEKVGEDSLGATFSFYFGHHMTTIEGGMVSTNDRELYDLMKMKRSHGLARESVDFEKWARKYPNIQKSFLFVTDGYNFRNHEICAVLGISQLKRLNRMIKIRKKNYKRFYSIMHSYKDLAQPVSIDFNNSSFCFPIICHEKEYRDILVRKLSERGIEYRPIVSGNLLTHPFLKEYSICSPKKFNNVDKLNEHGLYLGNSHFVGKKQMKVLEEIFKEIRCEI
jgi:CDP-6-deoxy-D-xylo-4-hexulose-3-dehydrase